MLSVMNPTGSCIEQPTSSSEPRQPQTGESCSSRSRTNLRDVLWCECAPRPLAHHWRPWSEIAIAVERDCYCWRGISVHAVAFYVALMAPVSAFSAFFRATMYCALLARKPASIEHGTWKMFADTTSTAPMCVTRKMLVPWGLHSVNRRQR